MNKCKINIGIMALTGIAAVLSVLIILFQENINNIETSKNFENSKNAIYITGKYFLARMKLPSY